MLAAAALMVIAAQPAYERVVEPHQTVYSAVSGDCRISLELYPTELNRRVVRYRAACPLGFAEQAPMVVDLFRHVLASESEPDRLTSLSWGRLYPDGARDATLAARLARAAESSPEWDPAAGRPRKGGINLFTRDLANRAVIHRELRDSFCRAGYDLRVSSMEKVLVLPARKLPFLESRSAARLPFDAMTWFALTPAADCRVP